MENDWRMHPLLSLQIYLTERAGKRGGCVWGWVDGWMEGAGRKGGGRRVRAVQGGEGTGERLGVAAVSFISS